MAEDNTHLTFRPGDYVRILSARNNIAVVDMTRPPLRPGEPLPVKRDEALKIRFNALPRSDFYIGMDGELDQDQNASGEWVRLEDVAKMLGMRLANGEYGPAE